MTGVGVALVVGTTGLADAHDKAVYLGQGMEKLGQRTLVDRREPRVRRVKRADSSPHLGCTPLHIGGDENLHAQGDGEIKQLTKGGPVSQRPQPRRTLVRVDRLAGTIEGHHVGHIINHNPGVALGMQRTKVVACAGQTPAQLRGINVGRGRQIDLGVGKRRPVAKGLVRVEERPADIGEATCDHGGRYTQGCMRQS